MIVTLDEFYELRSISTTERLFELRTQFNFSVDGVPGFVEEGYHTDLASHPLNMNVAEPWVARPAIPHDKYCRYVGNPPGCPPLSWWNVQKMFRLGMRVAKANPLRAWFYWLGVTAYTPFIWHHEVAAANRMAIRAKVKLAKLYGEAGR